MAPTKIKGTKGTHGTNGAHPTAGGDGQDESFTLNGTIGADSLDYLVTAGDGGLGGNSTVGDGAAGGDGGNAIATVNGNIFNNTATTNLTVFVTTQGGDGGLGGSPVSMSFNPGPQGNGGNATTTMNGNILQPSKTMSDVELDAFAIGGQGTKDGNAAATLSGDIVQVTKATTVTLDASATSNDPNDATWFDGNSSYGTKTATLSGNIVQGAITTVTLEADAEFSNASATLSGNVVNDTATGATVTLEATGQHIDIENNKITIGNGESFDLTVNELAPSSDTTIKGNTFTGGGTGDTFVFTDNGISGTAASLTPTPSATPDVVVIDLATQSFMFDGKNNKLKDFNNVTVQGNDDPTIIGDGNANILIGGDNSDTITGGGGNDTINGGAGIDTAVYTGSHDQYTIALSQTGNLAGTVTDHMAGRDGTDTLQNVEFLQFSDGVYNVATATFIPTAPVNVAPMGADKTITTLEDTSYTFAATDFGFSDPGNSPPNMLLAVEIDTLPAAGLLTDNGVAVTANQFVSVADINAGLLKFTPAPNANGAGYANFTFQVQDNGGTAGGGVDTDPTPNTITLNVTSVNDAPVAANKTITTLEDTPYTFAAGDFGFSDPNDSPANALLAVKIDMLPAAGLLTDNGVAVTANQYVSVADINAGLLKFAPAANANGANYANFTFQVQDNGGTTNGGVDTSVTPNTITLNVTSVNDAPIAANKTITTLEDTSYTFAATDFGFSDPNDSPANALLAVKIDTLPAAGLLTDNGVAVTANQYVSVADINSGLLKFAPAANANGANYANFTFQVQDNGGTTNGGVDTSVTPNTITMNVTSVNDAPMGADETVNTPTNTPYIFSAADFGFSDPNDSPANTLLNVKITNVPFTLATGALLDNGVILSSGATVSASDINSGKLEFDPYPGNSGTPYAFFNFEVQDNGGTLNGGVDTSTTPNTLTIDVGGAVNVAPMGADKTITTLEDTSYTFAATDFGFSDPGNSPPNALLAVEIDALPAAGLLTDNGVAVTANQFVSVADINAGLLKFAPAPNANGAGYANFTFQVQDNGGTAGGGVDTDPTPNTITMNVTSVNDAPMGADKTITTLEDTSYTFAAADFGFSDPNDSPANALLAVKIDALPAAGLLTDNGVAVTANQYVSVADINSGLLQFAPAPNANGNGYANFTFQVQDNGGTLNGGVDTDPTPNTITFNVTPVNDAPMGADKTVTTLEDTPYTFSAGDFGFSDPNDSPANALLAVKIDALPAAGLLTDNGVAVTANQYVSVADINSGLLQFAPASNANGNGYANFTFQVQDNGGTLNGGVDTDPTPNTITFDVTSVNDAPMGADKTVTTLEDTPYTFAAADFGFSDTNDNPANAFQAVKIDTLPAAALLTDNGVAVTANQYVSVADINSGLLQFAPASNANGNAYSSFTFQVQDNGGTLNGGVDTSTTPNTITFNVTSVNDAPMGADNTLTTLEDTPYTFAAADFGFSDPNDAPSNALLAVKITTLPTSGTLMDNGVAVTAGELVNVSDVNSGWLQFTPAPNANGVGSSSFTFEVQDNGGTLNGGVDTSTTPNTITFNVTPVNDAPMGADNTIMAAENTPYVFSAADFGFSDTNDNPSPNALLAVEITTLPAAGLLMDNGVAVTAGQFVSVGDINSGLLQFNPDPNTNGTGYTSFTFQVQDDGGILNGGVDTDPTPNTITFNVAPTGPGQTFTGTPGNDNLVGTPGNDTFIASTGNDTINGAAGSDTLVFNNSSGPLIVDLSNPNPQYIIGYGSDTLLNLENIDVSATSSNNILTGNASDNTLTGGAGDDTFVATAGNDSYIGNGGNNTIDLRNATSGVTLSLADPNPHDLTASGLGMVTLSGIENISGSAFGDTLTGDANANTITGGAGNDTINGGGGNDLLIATGGNDTLNGGAGTDTVDFRNATSGVTVSLGAAGMQSVGGGLGKDKIQNVENLTGSAYNDFLTGSTGNNVILGLGGDDTLYATAGNDTLDGGTGNNTADFSNYGFGVNVMTLSAANQALNGTDTVKLLNIQNLTGTAFADTLTGDGGNNILVGGAGNDTLNGGGGALDIFNGGAGNDIINGTLAATTDIAQFAGRETQYGITGTLGAGTVTVSGGPDGTDTLNNVDRVKFLAPSHVSDVDNNGFSDLVFQNGNTGAIQVNTNNGTVGSGNILAGTPADSSWHAIGMGQFTPDAAGTAARASGILLQQAGTGDMEILTGISGTASTTTPLSSPLGTFTGWTALATGDFNGDGASDILLSNGSGGLEIAFLNGTVGAPVGTVDSIQSVALPPGFSAVASGDFNGDGFSDILLKDGSGDVQVDLMRGNSVESSAAFSTNNLTAIGTGDFNGDGDSDILFTNNAGKAVIWTMNGTTKTGAFAAQDKPAAGYTLIGSADMNGDGISDLLWQNGSNVYVTLENGAGGALAGSGPLNSIVPNSNFHLLASTGGG